MLNNILHINNQLGITRGATGAYRNRTATTTKEPSTATSTKVTVNHGSSDVLPSTTISNRGTSPQRTALSTGPSVPGGTTTTTPPPTDTGGTTTTTPPPTDTGGTTTTTPPPTDGTTTTPPPTDTGGGTTTEEESDNTLMYILIAAIVGVALFPTGKKKKKKK